MSIFFSGHHLSCVNTASSDLDDLRGSCVGDLTEVEEVIPTAHELQKQCRIRRFFSRNAPQARQGAVQTQLSSPPMPPERFAGFTPKYFRVAVS